VGKAPEEAKNNPSEVFSNVSGTRTGPRAKKLMMMMIMMIMMMMMAMNIFFWDKKRNYYGKNTASSDRMHNVYENNTAFMGYDECSFT
jgi:hypothetical protein